MTKRLKKVTVVGNYIYFILQRSETSYLAKVITISDNHRFYEVGSILKANSKEYIPDRDIYNEHTAFNESTSTLEQASDYWNAFKDDDKGFQPFKQIFNGFG